MTRLEPVLSPANLPLAELCAARIDGDLYSIDECFSPIDAIESAAERAEAVRAISSVRLIAERNTAAWIRGAQDRPPVIHTFCASTTARTRSTSPRAHVREVVIDDSEIDLIAGMPVTTALRTALDIARHSLRFDHETATLVRRLLDLGGHSLGDCIRELDRRPNLPGKKRAIVRLQIARELPPPQPTVNRS
jgi:hypothetical protein